MMEEFLLELQKNAKVNNTSNEISTEIQVLQIFMGLYCVVGFITNAPLLYVLTKTNLTVTSNALILSLTFSNLLYVLFYLPFATSAIGRAHPHIGAGAEIVSSLCFVVWPYTLIALIARRCFDKPETPAPSGGRMPNSTVVVIAIWILAFVQQLPWTILEHINESEPSSSSEKFSGKYLVVETIIGAVTILAVPLFAIGFEYIYNRVATRNNEQSREQKEISNLVMVLIAVYTVCHVASAVFQIIFELIVKGFNRNWNGFDDAHLFLYFAYPFMSPVALYCASGSIRLLFKQHVFCCFKSANQEPVVYRELGMQPLVSPTQGTETLASP